MTFGLEQLSPPGEGSNYHDWEFAIRGVVMDAEYFPVLKGERVDHIPASAWERSNSLLCSC
ncbi:hypothetical protein CROQUDRAFT_672298 [Cronartium quercuum f. sp. fusiforme G11]|uniref:Uncharacterized protein n=1 Tax=Cronartium quercuum f. sp. fusiforme G11 TaxID=708437 RepID=A0A9P6T9W2_9BASI|nr:hypothetical protein CROQUDRAFT_672298 [Cronartium quercuum f. sp. fusiforme G11]